MSWAIISDLHIKEEHNYSAELFLKFLSHPKVLEAKEIFLLGDIFDMVVGSHDEYYQNFKDIFDGIAKLSKDKKIYYWEGNHDFFLRSLLKKICREGSLSYLDEPLVLSKDNKRILVCHGDEIEIDNPSYKIYKFFLKSWVISFLVKIAPYKLIEIIGKNMSKSSRKHNTKYEENAEINDKIKEKFRKSADLAAKKYNAEIVLCGHSHIKEHHQGSHCTYVNNGLATRSKSFIFVSDKVEIDFISLDEKRLYEPN